MDAPLTIDLSLEQVECLRGESVFFNVVVENASGAAMRDVPTLDPYNRVLHLAVQGPDLSRTAHALSATERDGRHRHGPEERRRQTLNPREKLKARGDLLEWLGELPPGNYDVVAHYTGALLEAESKAVKLKVLPASPVFASAPRVGQPMFDAPRAAAWVHKSEKGVLLFYQRQSENLPRGPRRGIRAASWPQAVELHAATLAKPGPTGHLVWLGERDQLHFAAVDTEANRPATPVAIKAPFAGAPLASPLGLPSGDLLLPLADAKKQRVALLQVAASGQCRTYELELGQAKPLGPYVCFWEYDARLHFAWTTPGGREVWLARLPLTDPAAGFLTRSAYMSDDPVAWLDAYVDLDAAFAEQPYFREQIPEDQRERLAEPPPAKLHLWCVTSAAGRIVCTPVNVTDNQRKPAISFGTPPDGELRVVSSVVTHRHDLCLLLADAKDRLHYASTVRNALLPLADVAKREITLAQFPGLMAAAETALEPWVYLRYVERQAAINYVRLEPEQEEDPVERARTGPPH